jgi:hypothetical protein
MLGVLDPEAAVPRPVLAGHGFIDIEEQGVGPVAARVDGDLQADFIGRRDPLGHDPIGEHLTMKQPFRRRLIRVRLKEKGRR